MFRHELFEFSCGSAYCQTKRIKMKTARMCMDLKLKIVKMVLQNRSSERHVGMWACGHVICTHRHDNMHNNYPQQYVTWMVSQKLSGDYEYYILRVHVSTSVN